jgi:hypothetical protein
MPDPADRLTPATPEDLADAIAFALRFDGRKRKHDADPFMASIVAERLVEQWGAPTRTKSQRIGNLAHARGAFRDFRGGMSRGRYLVYVQIWGRLCGR